MTILIALFSATLACTQAQCAESKLKDSTEEAASNPLVQNGVNGSSLINAVTDVVRTLKNYRFHVVMNETHEGKVVDSVATIYVKAPNMLRVEVGGRGPKSGSKLVRNGTGVIRFKGGPALFGITMTMEPDSRLLQLPSGRLVTQCDYLSLMQDLSKQIAGGLKVMANPNATTFKDLPGQDVIVLETHEPGSSPGIVSQRICIDAKTKVPLRWIRFKQGQLDAIAKFDNLQLNANVADDMFNI